jgi:hypothetical protein
MNPLAQVEIHRPGEAPVILKPVPIKSAFSFIEYHMFLSHQHASADAYKVRLECVIRPSSPFQ